MDGQVRELLSQRWNMQTNPWIEPVEEITALQEIEILGHGVRIDSVTAEAGFRFTNRQLQQCRDRFRRTFWGPN